MDLLSGVRAVDVAADDLALLERGSVQAAADSVVSSGLWSLARDLGLIEAALTAMVGEWEARRLHALDGSRSASARLARDLGISPQRARRLRARSRRLPQMPQTAAAFGRGELTAEKVDLLCRACTDGREAFFADAEANLLADAQRLGVEDLARVVQAWIDAADDAKAGGRARRDLDGRNLMCAKRHDGNVDLIGRLDPVQGEVLLRELERLERRLFEHDWAAARDLWGDDVTLSKLARTGTQRRADALAMMAERSSGADGTTPAVPLFTAHCDFETFRHLVTGRATGSDPDPEPSNAGPESSGRAPLAASRPGASSTSATGSPAPENGPPRRHDAPRHADVDAALGVRGGAATGAGAGGDRTPSTTARRCELDDGTVLTPHHLAPWLTDAEVERVVFGPGSRVLDLGRRSRLFRGGARRAVEIRDRRCAFPGCTVPLVRCDVDHVVEWSDGGETNPDNGRLLCGPHNRQRPGRTAPPTAGP